jgi:ubiquinone/menaquinone biosynthesis C-methylase UbiE
MSETQRDAYEHTAEIGSDPFHFIDRDNRNHRRKQDIILRNTHAETGDALLEVGCGDGLHAKRYDKNFEYIGVDLSESLVAEAAARVSNGATLQMDALSLAFDDNLFDAVVGTAILHHLPDPETALREWCRVTRPGGCVTLMEPNYLFPKDLVTAHFIPEEQHKTNMAPWRLQEMLDDLGRPYRVDPHIYTPPWPEAAERLYDDADRLSQAIPGLRWLSQMLLIHVHVE